MANLKDLRIRINSVESTRKITSAMKMVAASKLRRAQIAAEDARPYAARMGDMVRGFSASLPEGAPVPPLLAGTGKDETHLLVAVTADRGLCGGFNGSINRLIRRRATELLDAGKTVKILCIGKKSRDALKSQFGDMIIDTIEGTTRNVVAFRTAREIAARIAAMYEGGEFDVCTVVFNRFQSAMTQHVTPQQIIPFPVETEAEEKAATGGDAQAMYILEPDENEILEALLPRNLSVQVHHALT